MIKAILLIALLCYIEYIDYWLDINKISAAFNRAKSQSKSLLDANRIRCESPRINSLISSINSRIPCLRRRHFIFCYPATFLSDCVRSFFFPGSLIMTNSCRLTKYFLLLSGSGYTRNRHELPFGREIGHVAGNVLWVCSQEREEGRDKKRKSWARQGDAPFRSNTICYVSEHPRCSARKSCLSHRENPCHVQTRKMRT